MLTAKRKRRMLPQGRLRPLSEVGRDIVYPAPCYPFCRGM